MRYLAQNLLFDLDKKTLLLSGARQVGKTTLVRNLLGNKATYLNWDVRADNKIIREMSWPKKTEVVVLDELHKMPKWKNYLKGLIDDSSYSQSILVTGSARLDVFRKSGDALTGRTLHYRLHPIDVAEAIEFVPKLSAETALSRLLEVGGFPEAFLKPELAPRLLEDRLELVLRDDARDIKNISSLESLKLLVELLRDRIGGITSYDNLSQDLAVSSPTVKSWIEVLESLYLIFKIKPYSKNLARSIRKSAKIYFYDCAAGNGGLGSRLENCVAGALLKYCHFLNDSQAKKLELNYFRDRDEHEVDFVVTEKREPKLLIEVKAGKDQVSKSLRYLAKRYPQAQAFQLVRGLAREQEKDGIQISDLAEWLAKLPEMKI